MGFSVAQMVKNLPAGQVASARSLGQEDPLKKGMLPTLAFLPEEVHGLRSLEGYSPRNHKGLGTTE